MGGFVRLHVNEGYVFTSPKRVTSPTCSPSPPCKQALIIKGHPGVLILKIIEWSLST